MLLLRNQVNTLKDDGFDKMAPLQGIERGNFGLNQKQLFKIKFVHDILRIV